MGEPKTKCVQCERPILQRTADRKGGLCAICFSAAELIPPDNFKLPASLESRVVSLGKSSEMYRKMAWRDGTESASKSLDREEKDDALYREWLPKLQEFAENCRRDRTPVSSRTLSDRERAKQNIYCIKFNEQRLEGTNNKVNIFTMPPIAISVAEQFWPTDDCCPALLTPDEESRWGELCAGSRPENPFRWFSSYWWSIDDSPESYIKEMSRFASSEIDVPDGSVRWLVDVHQFHGPLAATVRKEIWSWNGKKATFIDAFDWIS